jgi:hypothetical protein
MTNTSKSPQLAESLLAGKPAAKPRGQLAVSSLRHANANIQPRAPQEAHSQQSTSRNLASNRQPASSPIYLP